MSSPLFCLSLKNKNTLFFCKTDFSLMQPPDEQTFLDNVTENYRERKRPVKEWDLLFSAGYFCDKSLFGLM
jgi:hypothetical protein